MNTFWLTFVIEEAIGVAEAFVSMSTIPPGIKAALQPWITAGENLLLAIQAGV